MILNVILYVKKKNDEGSDDYYVIFESSGNNSYGAKVRSMDYFKNHKYLGDDETEKPDE